MQRTILERIAGSFDAIAIWGGYGLGVVILALMLDLFSGANLDSPIIYAFLMGFFLFLVFVGMIGVGLVKIYCFWTNKPDPYEW